MNSKLLYKSWLTNPDWQQRVSSGRSKVVPRRADDRPGDFYSNGLADDWSDVFLANYNKDEIQNILDVEMNKIPVSGSNMTKSLCEIEVDCQFL